MEKEDKKYYEENIGSMIECMVTLKPKKDENGNYKTKEGEKIRVLLCHITGDISDFVKKVPQKTKDRDKENNNV